MKLLFPLLSVFLLLGSCASSTHSSTDADSFRDLAALGPSEFAVQKLRAKGASQEFIDLVLKQYRADQRDKVLELNFLGFLRVGLAKGDEKIPDWELQRVRKFIAKNKSIFSDAEKKYRVPKEVIASLLWVETKHGRDLGTFHVASALFSMSQADYPTLLDQMLDEAKKRATNYDEKMEKRISDRAKTKSDWAASELAALEEIHRKGWKNIEKLNGSFSGAFGMAQFVPTSYLTWAQKAGKKEKPNLFQADDSILSVANYLRSNGWEKKKDTHKAALFHYNRDNAYVTHILRMSDCLKKPRPKALKSTKKNGRKVASIPPC